MEAVAVVIVIVAIISLIRWSRRYSIPSHYRGARVIDPRGPRLANKDQRNFIWRKSGGRCAHCGKKCFRSKTWHPDRGEIDHIKPYSWGGTTMLRNLQLLCGECNRTKSDRYIG